MPVVALWERGPHIGHNVHCRFIDSKDVKWLIGFRHKKLCFIEQAVTIEGSRGVFVDQFRDDML